MERVLVIFRNGDVLVAIDARRRGDPIDPTKILDEYARQYAFDRWALSHILVDVVPNPLDSRHEPRA